MCRQGEKECAEMGPISKKMVKTGLMCPKNADRSWSFGSPPSLLPRAALGLLPGGEEGTDLG